MAITGHAQVLQIAKVNAKLESVVPVNPRPVIDKLELLHLLNKRAVAIVVEGISKPKSAISVDFEIGHALSGRIIRYIQAGRTRV